MDSMSLCSQIGPGGSPDRSCAFPFRPQSSSVGCVTWGWRHRELLVAAFDLVPAWALYRDLSALSCRCHFSLLSSQPQAYAGLGFAHPQFSHLSPLRSAKGPAQMKGSSGTCRREQPSPGCPTQRGPWKVRGALPSTLDWPRSTHLPSAKGLSSSPLAASADLWS